MVVYGLRLLGVHFIFALHAFAAADPLLLWYDKPAANWNEALPLGNARLGAMVFGGIEDERLQINENTLWAGGPHDYTNPEAGKYLAQLRELIFHRDVRQAEQVAGRMMGIPKLQQPYQPFCDLRLHFAENTSTPRDYRRTLDLDEAIASVTYRLGDAAFRREVFISHPDQVLVVQLAADKPGRISFDANLESPQPGANVVIPGHDSLRLIGQLGTRPAVQHDASGHMNFSASWEGPGLQFQGELRVRIEGGRISSKEGRLEIRGANAATLLFTGATSFNNYHDTSGNPAQRVESYLARVASKQFSAIRRDHVEDYQRLFRRVEFNLGSIKAAGRPTDLRIREFAKTSDAPLAVLLYQFGRYLLISSSRPGSQPPNLQGLWNQDLWPVWSSKYTTNINLEMNYWPAETGNLSECHEPLFDLIDDLRVTGAEVAKVHYHAGGFVLHHNTDLWRGAAPVDGHWGVWPVGAVWLCQHLWDHFQFTGDETFLRKRAYPAMKEAAVFILDFLVEAPPGVPFAGYLVTNPSFSPENGYLLPDGTHGSLTYAATLDLELIEDLFEKCARASEILGVDPDFRKRLDAARRRLPPLQIGHKGQLQEWIEDYAEADPQHRHVSHLYALYPSNRIDPDKTPELANAARKTLEVRGDGATGWSTAWKVALWARLRDGNRAYQVLGTLISGRTLPNMMSNCPPLQVDGSFGGTAGITEMLLQSQAGVIHLLPALPDAWPDGDVRGFHARDGIEVDIHWRGGKLIGATLKPKFRETCRLRYGSRETQLKNGSRRRLPCEW